MQEVPEELLLGAEAALNLNVPPVEPTEFGLGYVHTSWTASTLTLILTP